MLGGPQQCSSTGFIQALLCFVCLFVGLLPSAKSEFCNAEQELGFIHF